MSALPAGATDRIEKGSSICSKVPNIGSMKQRSKLLLVPIVASRENLSGCQLYGAYVNIVENHSDIVRSSNIDNEDGEKTEKQN